MLKLTERPPTTLLTLKLGSLNRPADRNAGLRPRQFEIGTGGPVAWSGGARQASEQVEVAPGRRIAANIAKLPELLGRKDYGLSAAGAGVASVGRDIVFNAHLVF
jgi:hypothetical protein